MCSHSKGRLREPDDLDGNLGGASIDQSIIELRVAGFLRFRSTDCLWKEVILAFSCRMGSDPLHSVSNRAMNVSKDLRHGWCVVWLIC
jgi:hypothetical protein